MTAFLQESSESSNRRMKFVLFTLLGWWLSNRVKLPLASLLIGLFGAINIPMYEHWAKAQGLWIWAAYALAYTLIG